LAAVPVTPGAPHARVVLLLVLIGPGGSIAMPAVTGVVLDSVPAERAGTASAVFNTFRQVGGAVGIAVFGSFLAGSATFVTGMQISFVVAAALVLVSALVSLRISSHLRPAA
jgi:DHA2 family methylenomycin A resistance protein-like MFS transporter